MEFLIVFAMIVIIMLFLGFGVGDIIMLMVNLLGVLLVLFGVFFALSLIMLIFSRKKRGVFIRVSEEGRFPCAVYEIDGEEYPNIFPCEMVLRGKLYIPEKTVTLFLIRFRRAVIDKNALITIIAGSVIFFPLALSAVWMFIDELRPFFGK